MTQNGQIYEKEKIEYGNQIVRNIAKAMLDEGIEVIIIMKIAGLTEEELLRLQNASVAV